MTQNAQHTEAATPYTILVTFEWGDAHIARYTRWNKDISADGTFLSLPSLDARFETALQAGTKDAEVRITMPVGSEPANTLTRPFKHARVKVKIEEIVPGDATSRRVLFYGFVKKAKATSSRTGRMARLTVCGLKARLPVMRIGMQALSTCVHVFGDELCGFDLAANTLTGTVTELNRDNVPNRIRVSFGGSPTLTNDRFARGFVEFDGLRLGIRQLVSPLGAAASFDLRHIPPPEWNGATVKVAPGCLKIIEACRDPFRNRESQFLAPGIAMPSYNPAFSDNPNA